MPDVREDDRVILDIGCGVGQTLVAMDLDDDRVLVGVDIDHEALAYGRKTFASIQYSKCTAEALPLASGLFDLVISRVAVPYTNIPQTINEMYRVLEPGGRVWFTLHPIKMTRRQWVSALRNFRIKDIIFRTYVLANGLNLHFFGKLLPFPSNGQYESCQSAKAIRAVLKNAGFENVSVDRGRHFLVTAEKPA